MAKKLNLKKLCDKGMKVENKAKFFQDDLRQIKNI